MGINWRPGRKLILSLTGGALISGALIILFGQSINSVMNYLAPLSPDEVRRRPSLPLGSIIIVILNMPGYIAGGLIMGGLTATGIVGDVAKGSGLEKLFFTLIFLSNTIFYSFIAGMIHGSEE